MERFEIFQDLLGRTAKLLNSLVNTTSENVISMLTPFLIAAFTIVILWYAYKVMFGQLEQPVSQLITKCLTWSIVMSLALTAGNYQTKIASMIQNLPNDVAAAIVAEDVSEGRMGSMLDSMLDRGIEEAGKAFAIDTGLSFSLALTFVAIGNWLLTCVIVLTVTGFLMLMMATIAASFLAALGPFFIAAFMFDSTRGYFWLWVNQILYWIVYVVLFALCAHFVFSMFGHYINDIQISLKNWFPTVTACTVVTIFGLFIFFWIPRIASALTGGGGQSMLSTVSTALGSTGQLKNAGKIASGAAGIGGNAAVGAGRMAGAAGRGAVSAAGIAYRYLRNTIGSSAGADSVKQVTHQPSKGHARK